MFGALIVPTGEFGSLEQMHSTAIQQILPVERVEEFNEFHASELYLGTGPFEGIDPTKRFTAIEVLLTAVTSNELAYVYAAVDRRKFSESPFGSGKPLYTAFHMCLLGIEDWARANHPNYAGPGIILDFKDSFLCILDDCDDKALKDQFRKTRKVP
jgi:hypothetical protein